MTTPAVTVTQFARGWHVEVVHANGRTVWRNIVQNDNGTFIVSNPFVLTPVESTHQTFDAALIAAQEAV